MSGKHSRHGAMKQEWLERFLEACDNYEQHIFTDEYRSMRIYSSEMTIVCSRNLVRPGVYEAMEELKKLGFEVVHEKHYEIACIRFHWSD